MNTLHKAYRFVLVLVAVSLWLAAPAQAAVPEHWKDTGWSISADGLMLRDVLEEFGRAYGVRVSITAKGDQYVKGKLKAENGAEFLERLTQPYKFRWFVYNETLYVVPRDESTSLRIEVGEDAVQDAKSALVGLGLFDSRFGWGELPDEGVIIVSGPRAYVNLVRDVLLPVEEKVKIKGKQIMVFRLKYASATDRVINSRGQAQTIPGVKTILSNLLFGPRSGESLLDTRQELDIGGSKRSREGKSGRGAAREVAEGPLPLFGKPKDKESKPEPEEPVERERAPRTKSRDERPRIEADPSLNAIMVYDHGSKREMYKALIAELDIEPQQIEIEALIVDIDRNKLSELGVEWGVQKGNTVARLNTTSGESQGVDLPIPGATLLISNAAKFYARLKALEGDGQARVLAKPTVLTLDNVAAVLDLSQTAYLPLVGERVADLANVTAGTMLRVVPRILDEDTRKRVRLEIDIEDGSLPDANLKANVTRSTISTQAIIDLQQTLMIGGYHAESVSSSQQKVPLLGDVPLFGNLFRTTAEQHSTRERLFLITPRLSGSGVQAASQSRANKRADRVAAVEARAVAEEAAKETTMDTASETSAEITRLIARADAEATKTREAEEAARAAEEAAKAREAEEAAKAAAAKAAEEAAKAAAAKAAEEAAKAAAEALEAAQKAAAKAAPAAESAQPSAAPEATDNAPRRVRKLKCGPKKLPEPVKPVLQF